ncbi:MAG: ribonuclease P protein subunit [Candidatus Odinarchaeum yellowstonii]|uniref:Ribonuclease P protein component 1 n=1 Tax=Odinarchaeota yellowstonii (strain LCB_4) TaxID=1841599 RepID=A0AAF0D1D5_ODILC|nr:MAG: ribonuclease P protein subunit [Candidatus Odinarchaeum yellowstonii]
MYNERTQKNILTLIGLKINIIDSSDRSLKGLTGLVLDETKNTLIIRQNSRILRIPKKVVRISLREKDRRITFNGSKLLGLPENRIKNYYWRR